jgi:hypothetical protein
MENKDTKEEKSNSIFGTSFTTQTDDSETAAKPADPNAGGSSKPGQLTE